MSLAESLFHRFICEGETLIDELIANKTIEDQNIDYKQAPKSNDGNVLDKDSKTNYAKAVSGFGNTEGGLIIWGVKCSRNAKGEDAPDEKTYINSPDRFKAWLEQATSEATEPNHEAVKHYSFLSKENSDKGFVVSYIPKSDRFPLQYIFKGRTYYMRVGSKFCEIPHSILQTMFGRTPTPDIVIGFEVEIFPCNKNNKKGFNLALVPTILNKGQGLGKNTYITLKIGGHAGINPALRIPTWKMYRNQDKVFSCTSPENTTHPPEAIFTPIMLEISTYSPYNQSLKIEGVCGCENGIPCRFGFEIPDSDLAWINSTIPNNLDEAKKHLMSFIQKENT